MVVEVVLFLIGVASAATTFGILEGVSARKSLHPPPRGRKRNYIRAKLRLKRKDYPRREPVDIANPDCLDPGCPHPAYALNFKGPILPPDPLLIAPNGQPLPQQGFLPALPHQPSVCSLPRPLSTHSRGPQANPHPPPQSGPVINISGPPEVVRQFLNGVGLGHQVHHGLGPRTYAGNEWRDAPSSSARSPVLSLYVTAPSRIGHESILANSCSVREVPKPQPRRYKKASIRSRGRAARWTSQDLAAASNRGDDLHFRRWVRAVTAGASETDTPLLSNKFARYDVAAEVPVYDQETYEKHLTDPDWSKEETDYLIDVYRECHGKWPVIVDHYSYADPSTRTMEELKARFYGLSATLLQLSTPITSMTAPEYSLYETLKNFNPKQEAARKDLAEGHLKRRQDEVDEESVLLSELQRIMLNQANVDNERDELRRRLDYPHANNGYQYATSQALTGLWQQMLHADRMRKNQRLRATGHPMYDGFGATPTSARPRDSTAGLPDTANMPARRATRDSLPSASAPNSLPVDLSKADQLRFGVVVNQEKLPSGVTFASDKLSKPRIAKSTIQTDKIAAILQHAGVPDLIPLPTPPVVEQFDVLMGKLHALLDLRRLKDKEEQELKVREAEAEAKAAAKATAAQ